jgi:hypothetical protein
VEIPAKASVIALSEQALSEQALGGQASGEKAWFWVPAK